MASSDGSHKDFRVAFLGAGEISTAHATALATVPNARLAAICDLDESKARKLQARTGAAEIFTDLAVMLERVAPDAVHILLPPPAHAAAAETCLAAGSHIFVEKPFCVTVEQCRKVERAAQAAGRQAGVNHTVTCMPGMRDVVRAIRECRLGAVQHIFIMYSMPMPGLRVGPHAHWLFNGPDKLMFELGSHPLSAVYRLGGRCREARSTVSGEMTLSNGKLFYPDWQIGMVCDHATAQAFVSVGKPYYNRWMHVLGEDGEAFVDFARGVTRIAESGPYTRAADFVDGYKAARTLFSQSAGNFWQYGLGAAGITPPPTWQQTAMNTAISEFYAALAEGRPVPMPATEGGDVVEMCEMAVSSVLDRQGSEVAHG